MIRRSRWTVFCTSDDAGEARRAVERLVAHMGLRLDTLSLTTGARVDGLSFEPYHKGGYRATLTLAHEAAGWNDLIVEVLDLALEAAGPWRVSGNPRCSLDGWWHGDSIQGIAAIEWACDTPFPDRPARFGFGQRVLVRATTPRAADADGRRGEVIGRGQDEDGLWEYTVMLDDDEESRGLRRGRPDCRAAPR